MPLWIRREAVPERPSVARARSDRSGVRLAKPAAVHASITMSHAASRLLPLAVRDGARCSPWTASANGRPLRLAIGERQPPGDPARNPLSRTRSACSIRPSPTTPASRSTPASTRSWASRPTASRAYAQLILDHLIDVKADGSFRLNLDYFNYCTGLTMTNERFDALFGGPPRRAERPARRSATWISPPRFRRSPKRSCCG